MSNKKSFLYYSRLSLSEGLNTESKTSQLCLERFDKDIYKKCRQCHQVFAIKKDFKKDDDTCNVCFELLQKEDKINPFMQIIWKDNAKYRVFTDLHRSYTDHIFRREPIRGKSGKISNEKLYNYLNSLLNY